MRMKSLILTALLSLTVLHSGAFLGVWNVPYVDDHLTLEDFTRKLDKVTHWNETTNSLRNKREQVAEDNYSLLQKPAVREASLQKQEARPGSGYHRTSLEVKSRTNR